MKLLIVGCGYVGSAVVRRLREVSGDGTKPATIYALTRTEQRIDELRGLGVQPVVGDWLDPLSLKQLDGIDVEYVLVSVPHRPVEPHGEQTHICGLTNLSGRLGGSLQHLIYLSTTGVYGDCENELVDERTPTSPTRIGPAIAVAAEHWLEANSDHSNLPSTTLRLAGIYGRDRIPLAAKLLAGEALAVPREGFLNLVHVNDIARMIVQILPKKMQLPAYLFSDGHPVLRETFYRELARRCGVDDPTFVDPTPGDSKLRRATSKKINPARLVEETDFVYQFPNYQLGLADALA